MAEEASSDNPWVLPEGGNPGRKDEPEGGNPDVPEDDEPEGGDRSARKHDESGITGPSLGPHTVIEREPVEERLARHEQSEVDAMGKDKRRAVVGESHGPSLGRQLALYGIFLAVVTALAVGGYLLIQSNDTGVGKDVPNSAPWSKPGAKQIQPKPIQ
jgi:hypothetical protein